MDSYVLGLLAVAILLPAFSAAVCYIIRNTVVRNTVVVANTLVLFFVAWEFTRLMLASNGSIRIDEGALPFNVGEIIKVLDVLLLLFIGYWGFKLKKPLIVVLTALQLIPVIFFEFFMGVHEPATAFVIDYLSLVLILLISIVGPIISVFAIGYMKEHEHHLHLEKTKQPGFFMVLVGFLGAMNALVMTNNLSWMYFFWEVTTLCSFLLIKHDENEISIKNAVRALWMNLTGGVAFIAAIILIYYTRGTLSVEEIAQAPLAGNFVGLFPIAIGLLCFAGFTKSAQFPFQSWLLGAMVAPTPVSALLHSSTMVKAGVYLVVRMAPAFAGTLLGTIVAVAGAFTFMAASAIAISQSNAKRVLAYSTIANLGLIIACAGIGNNVALGAAMLLIIFHGVSKGLLFLCVGTIEQGIGSRNIEDMQGVMKKMPFTTIIMVIGAVSMLLPPFGVMITKLLAIEASINSPLVMLLIVLGAAFTVVFWVKWIGLVLTMSYKPKYKMEKIDFSISSSLAVLLAGVLVVCIGIAPMFNMLVDPQLKAFHLMDKIMLTGGADGGIWLTALNGHVIGGFSVLGLFAILAVLLVIMIYYLRRAKLDEVRTPYLCGENVDADIRGLQFTGPGDKSADVMVRNYYFQGVFGEERLTLGMNLTAVAIILLMFGVVLR
ncbi:MAG: proton-conducting transporter membrane subunit [Nitrospirota bacterium]